jgi:hypothetical protein
MCGWSVLQAMGQKCLVVSVATSSTQQQRHHHYVAPANAMLGGCRMVSMAIPMVPPVQELFESFCCAGPHAWFGCM